MRMTKIIFKRRIIPMLIGMVVVVLTLFFQQSQFPFVQGLRDRMDWLAYDLRLQQTLPKQIEKHPEIVVIDVDDQSLKDEGRWPWPRAKIARLVDKLTEYGVIVTAFDIVFAEPEDNVANTLVKKITSSNEDFDGVNEDFLYNIETMALAFDGDLALSRTLADKDVVLGYAFKQGNELRTGSPGQPLKIKNPFDYSNSLLPKAVGFAGNIKMLQRKARGSGFFNAAPDADGVIRRSKLLFQLDGEIYPALALDVARKYLFTEEVELVTSEIGDSISVEHIKFTDDMLIPVNGKGEVIIPYRGGPYSFHYIPASDVLNGRTPRELLEAKVAFVGTSAIGLGDIKPTPVSIYYPGVEVHANILAGILAAGDPTRTTPAFPSEPQWADGLNVVITVVVGLTLLLVLPFSSPLISVIITLLMATGLVYGNVWAWTEQKFVLTIASPLLMIGLLASVNLAYGYLLESQGKKKLKDQFGSYVPPELVDQMMSSNEGFGFDGDKREMTVLFADIRSFTSISEKLTPTELKDMLNKFFTPMTEIIFNTQGTIDKYVGDMIMAFWGAPLQDDDHAKHAIEGALRMLEKVEEIKPKMMDEGFPEINLGVGLNTGSMNVGNMGSEFRRAYTVLGDNVNLGSRLEGLTKQYGVKLIVGETTREGQTDFLFRNLDRVRVKGKDEPVEIYEPVCRTADATDEIRAELDQYHQALEAYRSQKWDEARAIFTSLKETYGERFVYDMYLKDRMTTTNEAMLTADWDGVFTHTTK